MCQDEELTHYSSRMSCGEFTTTRLLRAVFKENYTTPTGVCCDNQPKKKTLFRVNAIYWTMNSIIDMRRTASAAIVRRPSARHSMIGHLFALHVCVLIEILLLFYVTARFTSPAITSNVYLFLLACVRNFVC